MERLYTAHAAFPYTLLCFPESCSLTTSHYAGQKSLAVVTSRGSWPTITEPPFTWRADPLFINQFLWYKKILMLILGKSFEQQQINKLRASQGCSCTACIIFLLFSNTINCHFVLSLIWMTNNLERQSTYYTENLEGWKRLEDINFFALLFCCYFFIFSSASFYMNFCTVFYPGS